MGAFFGLARAALARAALATLLLRNNVSFNELSFGIVPALFTELAESVNRNRP